MKEEVDLRLRIVGAVETDNVEILVFDPNAALEKAHASMALGRDVDLGVGAPENAALEFSGIWAIIFRHRERL